MWLLVHDLRWKEWEYDMDRGQKSQYFGRIGYSRNGFVHECCTLQRRAPMRSLCVVNDRIGPALWIASVMQVMPGVLVYAGLLACAGSVFLGCCPYLLLVCDAIWCVFMCIGMLFHLLSISLYFESFVAVNISFCCFFMSLLLWSGAGWCRLVLVDAVWCQVGASNTDWCR